MLYIVTYATHTERYLDILKESCPDLIVLGEGTKWEGFITKSNGIVDFCNAKKPDDLVCVLDGFDTVVLEQSEIEKRYLELGHDLIFSAEANSHSFPHKYVVDKLFSTCKENGNKLNAGMYMGTCKSIIDLWDNFKGGDDQAYATKKCKNIYIDTTHEIFYNYSPSDRLEIREGKLYFEDSSKSIPVIGAPGNKDINDVLEKLGKDVKGKIRPHDEYIPRSIKEYGRLFLPEISWLIISVLIFLKVPNKRLAAVISFLLLLEVVNIEVHVKHLNIQWYRKALYALLDLSHLSILAAIFWFMFTSTNLKHLLIVNTIFLIMAALFFHFKKCILSIIENKVAGIDPKCTTMTWGRIGYMVDVNQKYEKKQGDSLHLWVDGNKILVLIITLLNLLTLWRIRNLKTVSLK